MKSEFEKFATGLSEEDILSYKRLHRDVFTSLQQSRRTVFSFIMNRQKSLLIEAEIMGFVKTGHSEDRRVLQKSIRGAIENVRYSFSKEFSRARRKNGSANYVSPHQLSAQYVDGLIDRINHKAMKEAAANIVAMISGINDRQIRPISDEARPSWLSSSYEPAFNHHQEKHFIAQVQNIAEEMYVDPDEVYDFLYDIQYDDGSTITMEIFDQVAHVLGVEDVVHTNQLYADFEPRLVDIKNHFKSLALREFNNRRMSFNADDSRWFDLAEQINISMDHVAQDLMQIVVESEEPPIVRAVPSLQR